MPPGVVAGAVGVPDVPGGHVVGVSQADGEVPGVPGAPGMPCVPGVSVGPQTGGGVVQPGAPAGDCGMPGTSSSWPQGPYGETISVGGVVDGVVVVGVVVVLGAGVSGCDVVGAGVDGAGVVLVSGVAGAVEGAGAGGAGVVVVSAGGAGAGVVDGVVLLGCSGCEDSGPVGE
jgi:hypothetical protein